MDSSQSSTEQKRSVADIVSDVFPPFDHGAKVVTPFEEDGAEDAKFQESEVPNRFYLTHRALDSPGLGFERVKHVRYKLIMFSELNDMLLDLVIEFHAWASARPAHEREKMSECLEKEINSVIEKEKQQGKPSYVGTRMSPTNAFSHSITLC